MYVIVIGSGRVARHLSARLTRLGEDVVLVDRDPAALEAIPLDCVKVCGIPFDQDVLRNAGAETADVLVAASNNDNVNIMTCQVAQKIFSMRKVYARIANPENQEAFTQLGIQTVCSTSLVTDWLVGALADERELDNVRLFDSSLRFSTLEVTGEIAGSTLSAIEPDNNQMVFGVLRNGRLHLYNASFRVQSGDVIVICTQS